MGKSFCKGTEKRVKFFSALIIFIVAVALVIVIGVSLFSGSKTTDKSIIVYENSGGYNIRIGKLETIIPDLNAENFKCDTENNRVFYTVPSSYSDGMYDLYYIEKKRNELLAPKIIDYGIEKDYIFNSGKIIYLKNNSHAGAKDAFCCDFSDSTIASFSSNVENIYPLENSDTIFFIKLHGNERVLYKYSSESPIEVSRNISGIHLYNDSETPHLFYEIKSKIYNGMTELYRIESEGAPELICDNTYKVMYDEYISDGNLYYFTSSTENISWSYVIADAFAQTDKTITRPKRDDFFSILGISVEYNEKLREYQDKLVRDEIREALNESVEKGEFSAPVYTAFAYNSEGSHKVAENINPDKVYACSSFGSPRIIFENSEITQSTTDMSSLVEIAQRSSMSEVIEYARSVVENSIKSTGLKVAGCSNNGCVDSNLEGFDNRKTTFVFSKDGNRIFALVRDSAGERLNLYSCLLGSDLKSSAKVNISNGILSYYFIENSVVYLKSDIGKNTGDVYIYSGDDNIKLSNAATALKVENGQNIFVLKNYKGIEGNATADYFTVDDFKEILISEKILVDGFMVDNSGAVAYITSEDGVYSLNVFDDGEVSRISDNVTDIVLFN